MRAAANKLNVRLRQPLIIENKGWSSGILAAPQALREAAPDSWNAGTIITRRRPYNPLQFEKLPYDAGSDFAPIGCFLPVGGCLSRARFSVDSVAALEVLGAGQAESLNFATLGDGSFRPLPGLAQQSVGHEDRWRALFGEERRPRRLRAGEVQLTRFGIEISPGALQSSAVRRWRCTPA